MKSQKVFVKGSAMNHDEKKNSKRKGNSKAK
jgi:hypothetical protein